MEKLSEQNQLKVALYLRVSTEEQAERFGIDLQQSSLEGLLKSKGKLNNGQDKMIIAGARYIYIDEGISGTTPLNERPAFAQLKEDLLTSPDGQRPFDIVAVYKIDRFARKLKILLEVIDFFQENDVQFLSANESIDTSTPFGRAMLGIVGVIAELEIETTRERTAAGRLEALKSGVAMSSAPYGYKKDENKRLVIFEEESKVVRLIFDKFVNEKLSTQQIADYLKLHRKLSPAASVAQNNKRKGEIQKKHGIFYWRAERVRHILNDEVYIGKYYYNKSTQGKGKKRITLPKEEWKLSPYRHLSIIDDFIFKQAQSLLKQQKQQANARNKVADNHLYLLSGLLKCDCCRDSNDDSELMTWTGDRKKISSANKKARYTYAYKCGRKNTKKNPVTCNAIPIPADPLEEYVTNFSKQLLNNPKAVYNYQEQLMSSRLEIKHLQNKREEIKRLLNDIPGRKHRLKQQHEGGFIDMPALRSKIKDLSKTEKKFNSELEKVEYRIAQKSLSSGYIKTLKLFKHKYKKALNKSYENRQEVFDILHMLISRIVVYSRPITKKDKIAGRKRPNQQIPYRLEIELKLPQEILNDLASQFGVKSSLLWMLRDSNP